MKKSKKTPVPDIHPEEIVRILGYDMEGLRSKKRTADLSDQRRVVAVLFKRLGMVEWHIGDVLDRHPSSIAAMFRTSYLVEREIQRAVEQLKNSGYGKETKE